MLSVEESEFIEKLSGEFEVPATIPKWLWGGIPINKHGSFKIKSNNSTKLYKLLPPSSQYESPLVCDTDSNNVYLTQLEIEKEDLRRYASKSELTASFVPDEEDEQDETVSRTLDALDLEVSNF
jgi:hypothetical protein